MAAPHTKTWPDWRVEEFKELYASGMAHSAIAETLGLPSRSASVGKAHRLGLKRRGKSKRKGTAAPQQKRKHIRKSGKGYSRIRTHGISQARMVSAPEPEPAADEQIPFEQRRALLQLTNTTCRYPIGHPDQPDFYFCGGPADLARGRPYCAAHARRAFA